MKSKVMRARLSRFIITSLFLVAMVGMGNSTAQCEARQKESSKKIVVIARVIGVEVPEMGWPMEFQSLKYFYLKVERVLKGKEDAKYLRVAYGYNPRSQPDTVLPEEMFNGQSLWEFRLSRDDESDSKVEVSRKEGDWSDEQNSRQEGEYKTVPIKPKCVPTNGYQDEAKQLETMEMVKGYWLSWKEFKRRKA